jgi:drug/metabolite transporter (DMT)-like permease
MKYITNQYNYKNEWFNVLLSVMFTPFYGCFLVGNWRRIRGYFAPERRHILKYPVVAAALYTVETVLVFYALNTVTLSYYTILRSGFIIFNIPWFKYLLKKPVTRLYYASCGALVVSHGFAVAQYITHYADADTGVSVNTIVIFVSCFLNSTYNNLIEYAMSRYGGGGSRSGGGITNVDFQIIFQVSYFVIAIPWAIMYTMDHSPPFTTSTLTMYFFIAFGLQLYMFNKIYILNNKDTTIPANILLAGLDLIRRIIQLTYSFVCFNEPFDAMIGVSLVFLGLSGGLLLYQYIRDYRATTIGVNGVSIELSTLSRQRHHRFVDEDDYGAGAGHDADDEASRV